MKKQSVLLVDDEAIVRDSISEWLREDHYEVDCACDGLEALDKVKTKPFDTMVVDLKMPGIDGIEVMRRVKQAQPQVRVIIITAYGTAETAVEAMKNGASDFITKPFTPDKLEKSLDEVYGKSTAVEAPVEAPSAPATPAPAVKEPEKPFAPGAQGKQCIWSKAGVVAYRICINNFRCDSCEFAQTLMDQDDAVPQRGMMMDAMKKMLEKPGPERACRYMLSGQITHRLCSNVYQCGKCSFNEYMEGKLDAETAKMSAKIKSMQSRRSGSKKAEVAEPDEHPAKGSAEAKKSSSHPFNLKMFVIVCISFAAALGVYAVINPLLNQSEASTDKGLIAQNAPKDDIMYQLTPEMADYKKQYPQLAEPLDVYFRVFNLQQEYLVRIESQLEISDREIKDRISQGIFLLQGKDLPVDRKCFEELKARLRDVLNESNRKMSPLEAEDYISFNALSPFYRKEALRLKDKIDYSAWLKGICPVCGTAPMMGTMSQDYGKLILQCPLCDTAWRFQRLVCPFCDNTEQNTLRYFYPEDNKAYRVNVCEQCKKYLKVADERILKRNLIVPVENIITNYLDLVAEKEGYHTAEFKPR